jgi:ribosome-binding protein aMBF1 (putative translation factor)
MEDLSQRMTAQYPNRLPSGNYPAGAYMRASLARDIIRRRRAAGLSRAELARRAGIQPAVLNRIENARMNAETATVDKIVAALNNPPRQADCG